MALADKAVTAIGVSCSDSSRFRAVTITSSRTICAWALSGMTAAVLAATASETVVAVERTLCITEPFIRIFGVRVYDYLN